MRNLTKSHRNLWVPKRRRLISLASEVQGLYPPKVIQALALRDLCRLASTKAHPSHTMVVIPDTIQGMLRKTAAPGLLLQYIHQLLTALTPHHQRLTTLRIHLINRQACNLLQWRPILQIQW